MTAARPPAYRGKRQKPLRTMNEGGGAPSSPPRCTNEKSLVRPRPRLRPISISPDGDEGGGGSSSDDDDGGGGDGLGFDHILTGRAVAVNGKRTTATMAVAKELPAQPLREATHAEKGRKNASHHEERMEERMDIDSDEGGLALDAPVFIAPGEGDDPSSCDSSSSGDSDSDSDSDSDDDDSVASGEGEGEIQGSNNISDSGAGEKEGSEASDLSGEFERLRKEIRTRERKLAKLLRGKEGSAYARMMREQEDAANADLLRRRSEGGAASGGRSDGGATGDAAAEEAARPGRRTPPGAIRSMILEERHHSLPGAFSLVVHCVLYITIAQCFGRAMDRLGYCILEKVYKWDVRSNWFDYGRFDDAFHLAFLGLALVLSRATGVLYDWNEERGYQRRVYFHLRNKWFLKFRDARLLDFFSGGELREEYEPDEAGGGGDGGEDRTEPRGSKRWGPRLKGLVDLVSFFVMYKCVDHFVSSWGAHPASDITEAVMAGLPSRSEARGGGGARNRRLDHGARHSYACASVTSVLDGPYGSDMLEWIATSGAAHEEGARDWIANAIECGWRGPASPAREVAEGGGAGGRSDSCAAKAGEDVDFDDDDDDDADACEADADENGSALITTWNRRFLSAQDERYFKETVSLDQFHDIMGDPSPTFYDPSREAWFYVAITVVAVGVLWACNIPFLLI
ncbi:hypothetical protein ACHAWF_018020 [Thalassiosira exigua]